MIDTALSDHRTVLCSLSLRKPSHAKQQVKSRNLRRIDPTSFQTDVSRVASPLAECYDSELLVDFAASLRTIELLENGESSVLPRGIPDSELPDRFHSFSDQHSYLFEVNLFHSLLAIFAYNILLLAASFVTSSQYRKFVCKLANLSGSVPQQFKEAVVTPLLR